MNQEQSTEPSYLALTFTRPVPGMESEFREWYDNEHLPALAQLPGFVSAARYELCDSAMSQGLEAIAPVVAVYEITGNPEQAVREVGRALKSGGLTMSDAVDAASMTTWVFQRVSSAHHS